VKSNSFQNVGRIIVILFFTLVCLVVGIQIGVVFNRTINPQEPSPTVTPTTVPFIELETNQNNYLLVYVDRLQATRPDLKGVWLVVAVPDQYTFTILPIFPATSFDASEFNQELARSFSLSEDGTLDIQFLNQLRTHNYFWNHQLFIDDIGLISIYDQLSGKTTKPMTSTGAQLLAEMQPWHNSPQDALNQQHLMLLNLCSGIQGVSPEADIMPVLELIPTHFLTDIGDESLMFHWGKIKENPAQFVCEFPSFP
jgi:hypothetical protein